MAVRRATRARTVSSRRSVELEQTEARRYQRETVAPLSVLLVEDVRELRESLTSLLGLWGYNVRPAGTGTLALRMAEEEPPDVAIVDLGLPDVDGWAVARVLRTRTPPPHLIALTGAHLTPDEEARCRECFDDLVVKPDITPLEEILAMVARSRRRPSP